MSTYITIYIGWQAKREVMGDERLVDVGNEGLYKVPHFRCPLIAHPFLFISESDEGINASRAARRQVSREQGHHQ
jgi:hypothetical protein